MGALGADMHQGAGVGRMRVVASAIKQGGVDGGWLGVGRDLGGEAEAVHALLPKQMPLDY